MSRPFLENAKRANLVVRFQNEELNAIKKQAKSVGKPSSVFIREIVLNHFEVNGIPTKLPSEDPNQLKITDE
jgi:predicted DNA binding CopG/RHH family protein